MLICFINLRVIDTFLAKSLWVGRLRSHKSTTRFSEVKHFVSYTRWHIREREALSTFEYFSVLCDSHTLKSCFTAVSSASLEVHSRSGLLPAHLWRGFGLPLFLWYSTFTSQNNARGNVRRESIFMNSTAPSILLHPTPRMAKGNLQ